MRSSYYSGGRTDRGGRSNRGSTVCNKGTFDGLSFTLNEIFLKESLQRFVVLTLTLIESKLVNYSTQCQSEDL